MKLPKSDLDYRAEKAKLKEFTVLVLQTVKERSTADVDYRTYCLYNRISRYDDTVLSYVAKHFLKVRSQMKAHFFDSKNPNSIIRF